MGTLKSIVVVAALAGLLFAASGCDFVDQVFGPERDRAICEWNEDGGLDCDFQFDIGD